MVAKSWKDGYHGELLFDGTEFQFGKMNSSKDGQWQWLHNNMCVLNTSKGYT